MGTQAAATLPVLPLGSDRGAEYEGGEQAEQVVEKLGQLEGIQERH
jgi:hypothetical protein